MRPSLVVLIGAVVAAVVLVQRLRDDGRHRRRARTEPAAAASAPARWSTVPLAAAPTRRSNRDVKDVGTPAGDRADAPAPAA